MSEQESLDLGKVVSLIMENPALIEQISALAKQSPTQTEPKAEVSTEKPTEQVAYQEEIPKATYTEAQGIKSTRSQLLGALKPYLSKERARAIDSMISIVDILDMMKGR